MQIAQALRKLANLNCYYKQQMVIFNQTFVPGKEVIFPENWQTGQTMVERFEQTRKSMPWLICAKIAQLAVAFFWILLMYTIGKGLFELWKVWREPQGSPRRREYRKVLEPATLASILSISLALLMLTVVLAVRNEWIASNLLQASAIWVALLVVRRVYSIFRPRK